MDFTIYYSTTTYKISISILLPFAVICTHLKAKPIAINFEVIDRS